MTSKKNLWRLKDATRYFSLNKINIKCVKIESGKFLKESLMKIKTLIPTIILAVGLMSGCGNSSSNQSASSSASPLAGVPSGPVNYTSIRHMFNDYSSGAIQTSVSKTAAMSGSSGSGGCGKIMGDAGAGLTVASGFISLIPEAGPVLGAIVNGIGATTTLFGANAGNNCMQQQFNMLETQLSSQQTQINALATQVASDQTNALLMNNSLFSAISSVSTNVANSSYNTFNTQIKNVVGSDGYFMKVMQQGGFYTISNGVATPTSQTISSLTPSSSSYLPLYMELNNIYNNANLYAYITNITGSSVNGTITNGALTYAKVAGVVTASSSYINLLNNTYNAFTAAVNANLSAPVSVGGQNANIQNIVPLFDQYNNLIVSYYEQSLYAMQEIYTVMYTINQINYQNGVNNPNNNYNLPNIITGAGLPTIYYSYSNWQSAQAQANAYNQAQEQLTILFASLVNQLYQNTTSYIVTDKPVGAQAWPITKFQEYNVASGAMQSVNESVSYANVGANVSTATNFLLNAFSASYQPATGASALVAQLKNLTLPSQTSGYTNSGIPNSVLFYQYGGLNNAVAMSNNINAYNATNAIGGSISTALNYNVTAPSSGLTYSLLSDTNSNAVNQSSFSQATIQPYLVGGSNNLPLLSGSVGNNISACNPSPVGSISAFNVYWYVPNALYTNNSYNYTGYGTTSINWTSGNSSYYYQSTPVSIGSLGNAGTPYLMCGNWSTQGVTSFVLSSAQSTPSSWGSGAYNTNTDGANFIIANNANFQINGPFATTFPPIAQYLIYINSDSATTWNNLIPGQSIQEVMSGWFPNVSNPVSNIPNSTGFKTLTHTGAFQYTFPDGFIASFGLSLSQMQTNNGAYQYYPALTLNPNLQNVTINTATMNNVTMGVPLINQSDPLQFYGWNPIYSRTMSVNGGAYGSAIAINGNVLALYGGSWEEEYYIQGKSGNTASGFVYIAINPAQAYYTSTKNGNSGVMGSYIGLIPSQNETFSTFNWNGPR